MRRFTGFLLVVVVYSLLCGCEPVPCESDVDDVSSAANAGLTYYDFHAPQPKGGYCEQQVFGAKNPIAEPVNFAFAITTFLLGLFAVLRSVRTTMAFQFLYAFLSAYGLFGAAYHVTVNNGFYRMMDVTGSFVQSFIVVMLAHSLYLYRMKVTDTEEKKRRYRYLTNLVTMVFTMYPAAVHVAGESSANPWVAWLVFDLLWIVIATMLILIWKRRKSWPGISQDARVFRLVWYAIVTCIIAYAGWCIDKFLCTCETPWLAYFQTHGIWHLFMGLCFYYMITLNRFFSAHEYNYTPVLRRFPQHSPIALPFVEWQVEKPSAE
ncbi:MAG: ceramidase domain-containing protein [Deltaproteobacteria bacterium]|nr:ceramidase domain-containing protein [Deltaproteobacteria bacterium]MBN2671443.1 ceramidase domain-containing protein [Deltaproteobacteria bacterium]